MTLLDKQESEHITDEKHQLCVITFCDNQY